MKSALNARLKKLEARVAASDEEFPIIVFGDTTRSDDDVVGVNSNGQTLARSENETVEELIVRGRRKFRQLAYSLSYADGSSDGMDIVYLKIV